MEKLNNAELRLKSGASETAAAYSNVEEMKMYQEYLKTIKLESEMNKSTNTITVYDNEGHSADIPVKDMVGTIDEFENTRRIILVKLNAMARGNETERSKLKRLMSNIGTNSLFLLSGEIANIIYTDLKRNRVLKEFYNNAGKDFSTRWNYPVPPAAGQQKQEDLAGATL